MDRLIDQIYAATGISEVAEKKMNAALADAFITGCGALQVKIANGEVTVVHVDWLYMEGRP